MTDAEDAEDAEEAEDADDHETTLFGTTTPANMRSAMVNGAISEELSMIYGVTHVSKHAWNASRNCPGVGNV